MAENLSAAEHLSLGRAALVRQREEIDQAIAAIDAVLATLARAPTALTERPVEPQPAATPHREQRQPASRSVPTVKEAIVAVLDDAGAPMKVADIINGVADLGVRAEDDTVRSVIVKLAKAGRISKVAYGTYGMSAEDDPADAESPVAAGLSVLPVPTSEGGEDGQSTGRDREDHVSWWSDRDHRDPSVMEG